MRLVGILGTPFCGSTLLCRLMSSVPGLEVGGEVHWIDTLKRPDAHEYLKERRLECAIHPIAKGGCPVFTEEWLRSRRDPAVVYDDVAAALDAEILLVSDKEPRRYDQLEAAKRIEMILLFKAPLAHCTSNRRHRTLPIELALGGWSQAYTEAIMWAQKNATQTAIISYERLAAEPVEQVRALCNFLELPAPQLGHGELPSDYHHIAGNSGAHASTKVTLDEGWKTELTEEEQRVIKADQRAARLHHLLRELAL